MGVARLERGAGVRAVVEEGEGVGGARVVAQEVAERRGEQRAARRGGAEGRGDGEVGSGTVLEEQLEHGAGGEEEGVREDGPLVR